MKYIVKRRQERRLVEVDKPELAFRVRGTEVEPANIDRWMKRNGVSDSMPYSPGSVVYMSSLEPPYIVLVSG
jgi:hypothetical protein